MWRAEHPVAVVQLTHDLGEHTIRSFGIASQLAAAAFSVFSNGRRWHGITGLVELGGDPTGPGALLVAVDVPQ